MQKHGAILTRIHWDNVMGQAEETYMIHEPQTDDAVQALREVIRQLNVILLRIAERIADKADA